MDRNGRLYKTIFQYSPGIFRFHVMFIVVPKEEARAECRTRWRRESLKSSGSDPFQNNERNRLMCRSKAHAWNYPPSCFSIIQMFLTCVIYQQSHVGVRSMEEVGVPRTSTHWMGRATPPRALWLLVDVKIWYSWFFKVTLWWPRKVTFKMFFCYLMLFVRHNKIQKANEMQQ